MNLFLADTDTLDRKTNTGHKNVLFHARNYGDNDCTKILELKNFNVKLIILSMLFLIVATPSADFLATDQFAKWLLAFGMARRVNSG